MAAEFILGFMVGTWSYIVEGEGKSLIVKLKR